MADTIQAWELLGIRQLAATDEYAEEFTGTLLIHRRGATEPVETIEVTVKRAVLTELESYVTRLLRRSRGLAR
ncbi:MAG: hypothetical protein ACRELA_06860 [Candidatus Rokuibacteriota bacterium]